MRLRILSLAILLVFINRLSVLSALLKVIPTPDLPLLEIWNDSDIKNDQGIASTSAFTPYAGTLIFWIKI